MAGIFSAGHVWGQITASARAAQGPASVAVAYFGSGGSQLLPLPKDSVLVVDAGENAVKAGVTCPADLERYVRRGTKVFSFLELHAKVFVFDEHAFVGSANVSHRSSTRLVEAIVRVRGKRDVRDAREFVRSLCIHELDLTELQRLGKLYRPPKFTTSGPNPTGSRILVMELTREQGAGRETQVQPPKPVWTEYFKLNVDDQTKPLPRIQLRNTETQTENSYPVSHHDHNWTIEVPAARMPRPAILRMARLGRHHYEYSVVRPSDPDFQNLDWSLNNCENPHHTHGRRWFMM